MVTKFLLPDGEIAERVRPLVPDVAFTTWSEASTADDLSAVEFYVPPYMGGPETVAILSRLGGLKVVQLLTAGVDWIAPYVRDGVVVCNARGVHEASTAELAVAGILAMAKEIPRFVRLQERAEWGHRRVGSLSGKRAVVLGYGAIGRAVAARLAPFGVDVTGVTRSGAAGSVPLTALADVLPGCDILVVTLPLTDETTGLVGASALALLPDGALVTNVARGPVVDQAALTAELVTARLRAVLDVMVPEPLPPQDPLWQLENVLITPHVGGNTDLFPELAAELVAAQLSRFLSGAPLEHRITSLY